MKPMTRAAFSQRLVAESPNVVCVHLRDSVEAVEKKQGEIILDINRSGNWVRGFEVVGGFVPFSVAKAVTLFDPVRPGFHLTPKPGTVTYDPEADAAFFYLEYGSSFNVLGPSDQSALKVISHSINPMAIYGLDKVGGLIWVRIPVADVSGPADQFLSLLRR